MKYIHKFKVRFSDTDMYGIVHHKNYYDYFDEARFNFASEILEYNEKMPIKFIVTESNCVYKNPLKFSVDFYVLELECKIIKDIKLEYKHVIKSGDRKIRYAYGKVTQVIVDEHNKLCTEIPECIKNKLVKWESNGL